MKAKGILKSLTLCSMCAGIVFISACDGASCQGCGNHFAYDGNYTLNYIVISENGHDVLHKVKNWSDSESESVMVATECCNNYIWSSANNATLYRNKPSELSYDVECEDIH